MTAARTPVVASGFALAGVVALAVLLRLAGLDAMAMLSQVSGPAFYLGAAVLLFLAVLLVMVAPASRKRERRVELQAPVTRNALARPRTERPARAPAAAGAAPRPAAATSTAAGKAGAKRTVVQGSGEDSAAAQAPRRHAAAHPNDAIAADSEPIGARTSSESAPAAEPPAPSHRASLVHPVYEGRPRANQDGYVRHTQPMPAGPSALPGMQMRMRRREALQDRLDVLQQKAGAVKVSFGLGRISGAGYRQYLKEVDQERMLIEAELMSLQDGHEEDQRATGASR